MKKDILEFWIYILEVKNGNLYTGYTRNLNKRLTQHFSPAGGCKFTRTFRPVALRRCWKIIGTYSDAMTLEVFIKKQARQTKLDIISHPSLLWKKYSQKKDLTFAIKNCRKKFPLEK